MARGGVVSAVLAASGPSLYWYLTRSTGAVALLLLTIALVLGVLDVQRWSSPRWPRFVVDSLHRSVSLLALAFLVVHILTSVLDSFAPIGLLDAIVPFAGSYRPFWLGLGAVSFDLILAVIATSLLRQRMGYSAWRAVHWLTYASWPIALLHGFGTGSDVKSTWLLVLSLACAAIMVAAVVTRVVAGWPANIRSRGAALGGAGAFSLFLALWLPGGPLGHEWARDRRRDGRRGRAREPQGPHAGGDAAPPRARWRPARSGGRRRGRADRVRVRDGGRRRRSDGARDRRTRSGAGRHAPGAEGEPGERSQPLCRRPGDRAPAVPRRWTGQAYVHAADALRAGPAAQADARQQR